MGSAFGTYAENKLYPDESFDAFVSKMIKGKKRIIANELGVPYESK
ncbi:hypothetical protein [Halobacillus litoralis]|nr:hypothetical protein [Halobacillus litoralis]MYL39051.1 hypothetical protein [Halobacillus litoralis]